MAQLVSRLPLIANKIDDRVEHAIDVTATFILMMIKVFAPVDTGALRSSYRREDLTPLHILIGSAIHYSIHQEYGTRYQPGTPHLTPGFDKGAALIKARISAELQNL